MDDPRTFRFTPFQLLALAVGAVLFCLILWLAGCADPERVRSEKEAAADAQSCGDKIDRIIGVYVGPSSTFCASVQAKVDELVRTDRACLGVYLHGQAPVLCLDGGVP